LVHSRGCGPRRSGGSRREVDEGTIKYEESDRWVHVLGCWTEKRSRRGDNVGGTATTASKLKIVTEDLFIETS
jgi:hypothetical protein